MPDSEYIFEVDVPSDVESFSNINNDTNPFEVSVKMKAAGNILSNLDARESLYSKAMTNDATLGICSEFIYDEGCKIEEAVIQFKIDDEYAVEADTKKAEDSEFYTLFPLLISVLELGNQGISTAFSCISDLFSNTVKNIDIYEISNGELSKASKEFISSLCNELSKVSTQKYSYSGNGEAHYIYEYYYDNSNSLEQSIINLAYSRRFAEMKYSENMLAIPLWIRKYIYDYTSTVDTDNGEMDLLAYRNILYIEDNFTKGDLAI